MAGGVLNQRDIIAAGLQFPRCKLEYDVSDQIIYKGTHHVHSAADGHSKWMITKFTYTGTNSTTRGFLDGPGNSRLDLRR